MLMMLMVTGCGLLKQLGELDLEDYRPTLTFKSMELRDLNFDEAAVDFHFKVDNPNPSGIDLSSFSWNLLLQDQPFLDGINESGLKLEPQGSTTVTLPVTIGFEEMLGARELKGLDEVDYRIDGNFGFMTPVGELQLPYTHKGALPVLRRPKAAFHKLNWKGVDLGSQTANLGLVLNLSHEQGTNLSFLDLGYTITFEGTEVGSGVKKAIGAIDAGQTRKVALPIEVQLVGLGSELVKLIKNKKPVDVGLVADVDVETPWDFTIPLHIEREKEMSFSD